MTASGAAPLTIPVTLNETAAPTINPSPNQLSFHTVTGSGDPPPQNVALITASTVSISFTAAAATSSGGNWLSVQPAAGSAPGTLTVSVSSARLSPGAYQGTVTVTALQASNSPVLIPVSFTMQSPPALQASPENLGFAYQDLSPSLPPSEPVSVSTSGRLHYSDHRVRRDVFGWHMA